MAIKDPPEQPTIEEAEASPEPEPHEEAAEIPVAETGFILFGGVAGFRAELVAPHGSLIEQAGLGGPIYSCSGCGFGGLADQQLVVDHIESTRHR